MTRRTFARFVVALSLGAVVLAAGEPARAQAKGERAARAHFQRAEKSFNLGKFDEALRAYEAAYEAKPLPAFLFNIAQCHRNLGNPERAVFFYERFLALEPATSNRATVEELIAEQRKLFEPKTTTAPDKGGATPATAAPPAAEAAPASADTRPRADDPPRLEATAPPPSDRDESPPVYKRWWFWGAAAVLVAGGVAAFVLTRPKSSTPGTALGPPIDYTKM